MKIKSNILIIIAIAVTLASCGHSPLKTKEEAVKFLESNKFSSSNATITGLSGGKIQSPFSLSFNNGNAQIDGENLPYTIVESQNGTLNGINYGGPGFIIKFCGSQKYAFDGCIDRFLTGGIDENGKKSKYGPCLKIRGSYVNTDFSEDEISKK